MLEKGDIIRAHDQAEVDELLTVLDQEHTIAEVLPRYNDEAGFFIKIIEVINEQRKISRPNSGAGNSSRCKSTETDSRSTRHADH